MAMKRLTPTQQTLRKTNVHCQLSHEAFNSVAEVIDATVMLREHMATQRAHDGRIGYRMLPIE